MVILLPSREQQKKSIPFKKEKVALCVCLCVCMVYVRIPLVVQNEEREIDYQKGEIMLSYFIQES